MSEGILDTNTVILLPRIRDPSVLPDIPLITTITLAELSVGPLVTQNEEQKIARQSHLQQAEADFEPIPFDEAAARVFGYIAAELRSRGRKTTARAYDALIAAIAVSRNLPLYTVNPGDFSGIGRLDLVVIPHPDRSAS